MKYIIKLTCWDYPNPTPYTEYVTDGSGKPMEFETRDSAMVMLLISAMEESNNLNFYPDENGECVDRRQFIPDLSADHDCIIRAWDGEDYMPVTAYDVVAIEEESEVNYESN